MLAANIVLALLVVGLVGALARTAPHDRLLRERLREDVVVTMKSGEAFRGVLFAADGRSFILRDAKALTDASARPVPVDGELILPRDQIDYFQRP
jgi:small nuclear ribonucleoprotein (snRNP)-like protein